MEKNSQPLVSIVIPCYNHENFVQDCIQSVIDQTYQNIELIIIDDGSKDNSILKILDMVDLCKSRFVNFEFIYRDNKGISATLNEGLDLCNGTYISLLSSDDYYHENKISEQINFLKLNKNIQFAVTKSYVVNDLSEVLFEQTKTYNLNLGNEIGFEDIFIFKTHLPITGLYSAKLLKEKLKGFDINITAEDYDIYLKIAQLTKIGIINKKLYYYRSPEAIGTGRIRMPMRVDVSESHLMTIQKYKSHPLYSHAIREWNLRRFIYFSAYTKTKKYAAKGMLRSFSFLNNILFYKALFRLFFYWKRG